jgi:hypothetical protein
MHLGTVTPQALVEADNGLPPICHVCALQEVNVLPGTGCVVVANEPPKPRDPTHTSGCYGQGNAALVHDVAPPDSTDLAIAGEVVVNAGDPFPLRTAVIIREGDQVAPNAGETGVQGGHLARAIDTHNFQRKRAAVLPASVQGGPVVSPNDEQHLIRGPSLVGNRLEAAGKIVRSAKRRHYHCDGHVRVPGNALVDG